MAIIRSLPRKRRLASYRNIMMVDAVRGVLRVRKWPKKRGKAKSERQQFWIDWFTQANLLAKYADGMSRARAIEMTRHTGMYPRDILLKAMRGRLYFWSDETGWKWYSMAAIGDISESLDVLAQTVGSVLVRAVDRWRAPNPANVNDVLTYKGDATPPIWQPPSAGGLITTELVESPITPDDTKTFYDFDVSGYAAVEFTLDNISLSAAASTYLRYSTDGGATFHDGATEYRVMNISAASEIIGNISAADFNDGDGASLLYGSARIENLRAGKPIMRGFFSNGNSARLINCIPTFSGPITDVRVLTVSGATFKTGTIRAVGFVA